jgi:hypothetical protein
VMVFILLSVRKLAGHIENYYDAPRIITLLIWYLSLFMPIFFVERVLHSFFRDLIACSFEFFSSFRTPKYLPCRRMFLLFSTGYTS